MERPQPHIEQHSAWERATPRAPGWLLLCMVVVAAILVRSGINFSDPLVRGVNGAYYLVQVRSVMEAGHLRFPDLPLLFWLEALLARALMAAGVGGLENCVLLACKMIDSLLPALAAFPVFLLAREWNPRRPLAAVGASAFSVLYFAPLIMTGDLQKNALGLTLALWGVYFIFRALRSPKSASSVAAVLMTVATGLTHIGAFAALGFFLLAMFVAAGVSRRSLRELVLPAVVLAVMLLVAGVLYRSFDPERAKRLAALVILPTRLFHSSMLGDILGGAVRAPEIVNLVLMNALALAGAVCAARIWNRIEPARRVVVVAGIAATLLLSSPLIGMEWATRLQLMAYAPAAVVLAFILAHEDSRFRLAIVSLGVALPSAALLSGVIGRPVPAAITAEAYAELCSMRRVVPESEEVVIVARHGLEWWAAWTLRRPVFTFKPERMGELMAEEGGRKVLFLQQFAGVPPLAQAGPGGAPFPEASPPPGSRVLFIGRYFQLGLVTGPLAPQPPRPPRP